jgi:hypothetical protein
VGQVDFSGSLTLGPASGGSTTFPSSTDTIQLALSQNPKQASVMTGTQSKRLSSAVAYVTLSGVGGTLTVIDTVTRCDFLYIRSDSAIKVRLTMVDPAGGADIVSVLNLQGPIVIEFPTTGYCKLVEAMGVANIEYAASGIQ